MIAQTKQYFRRLLRPGTGATLLLCGALLTSCAGFPLPIVSVTPTATARPTPTPTATPTPTPTPTATARPTLTPTATPTPAPTPTPIPAPGVGWVATVLGIGVSTSAKGMISETVQNYDPTTRRGRIIVTPPAGSGVVLFDISPNGRELAYAVETGFGATCYVAALDGSGSHAVAQIALGAGAAWEHDSRHLALSDGMHIILVDTVTGGQQTLTTFGGTPMFFSPNDAVLYYTTTTMGSSPGPLYTTTLFAVALATPQAPWQIVRIVGNLNPGFGLGAADYQFPTMLLPGPDGQTIYYYNPYLGIGVGGIYAVSVNGGTPRLIRSVGYPEGFAGSGALIAILPAPHGMELVELGASPAQDRVLIANIMPTPNTGFVPIVAVRPYGDAALAAGEVFAQGTFTAYVWYANLVTGQMSLVIRQPDIALFAIDGWDIVAP